MFGSHEFSGPYSLAPSSEIPAVPGVYVIAEGNLLEVQLSSLGVVREQPEPIYIGQARDIRARLSNHERQPCWESKKSGFLAMLVAYVFVIPSAGVEALDLLTREQIEGELIRQYDPPCNRTGTTSEQGTNARAE